MQFLNLLNSQHTFENAPLQNNNFAFECLKHIPYIKVKFSHAYLTDHNASISISQYLLNLFYPVFER